MVVMDDISLSNLIQVNPGLLSKEHLESRNVLSKNIGQCLRQFHEAGFAHGDFGERNIMVKTGGFSDGYFR